MSSIPINCPIVRVPEVVPCDASELDELVAWLESDASAEETRVFARGTFLPDGRLDLCKQGVGPLGCARLTGALKTNSRVKSVLLGTDAIGDVGASSVARLIESNLHLEVIYLGCNGISSRGAGELARVLESNSSVKGLWLKRNPIGDDGLLALAQMLRCNTTLEVLDVVNCGFGGEAFARLVATLRDENRTLKRFYAGGNGAPPALFLAECLNISPALEGLFLNASALENRGAKFLGKALSRNRALRELGIGSNGIGLEGLSALCDGLAVNQTLESLDLGRAASQTVLGAAGNDFQNGGELLAAMLRCNTSLHRLNLRGTKLGQSDLEPIFEVATLHPRLVELLVDAPLPVDLKQRLDSNRTHYGHWAGDAGASLIKSVYRTARKVEMSQP
jgi:hypothetical protein